MANPNTESGPLDGTHFSDSPEKTRMIAAGLAKSLDKNSVVALVGDLGAGKTEFVKGLAHRFACEGPVTSPTFAIAHEYEGAQFPIFHFDFYRMEDPKEFETCGFEECVGTGLVIAEWADKFAELLPSQTLWISIRVKWEPDGTQIREITSKNQ